MSDNLALRFNTVIKENEVEDLDTKWTVQKVKDYLFNSECSAEIIEEFRQDHRKGVQKLLVQYDRKQAQIAKAIRHFEHMSSYEKNHWEKGKLHIVGIDEVGRGPLAGPVVAAAVILPKEFQLIGIDDSKKLSKEKREEFYEHIIEQSLDYNIGIIEPSEIDQINIFQATKKAMRLALNGLSKDIEHILIDAMQLEGLAYPSDSIIKGDQKSISIAAASIVAKVTRDRLMEELHLSHPHYDFHKNSGYGTRAHIEAIKKYGLTKHHRRSFLKSLT